MKLEKSDFSCWDKSGDKYDDELIIEHDTKLPSKELADQILQDQKLRELAEEEFQYYDETFKKHKDIDDFKVAQVLQKILKRSKK